MTNFSFTPRPQAAIAGTVNGSTPAAILAMAHGDGAQPREVLGSLHLNAVASDPSRIHVRGATYDLATDKISSFSTWANYVDGQLAIDMGSGGGVLQAFNHERVTVHPSRDLEASVFAAQRAARTVGESSGVAALADAPHGLVIAFDGATEAVRSIGVSPMSILANVQGLTPHATPLDGAALRSSHAFAGFSELLTDARTIARALR